MNQNALTPKQERFCQEIVKGNNQSDAYRLAFKPKKATKKSIHERASQIMADIKVQSRINALRAPVVKDVQVDMARRLKELGYAAILDPIDLVDEHGQPRKIHEMPEHARRAIAGYEVDPETFVTKLKFVDKRGAIMDYTKLAGDLPAEAHQITGHVTVGKLVSMIIRKEGCRK